jgi:fatty acid synthase subunit alpha, fungi type
LAHHSPLRIPPPPRLSELRSLLPVEYYQGIYQRFGSCGSVLTVVPFSQDSKQDVEVLVDYIYTTCDLDCVIPFAPVPENGREIDGLDDKSELVHRIMLVNLLRLLAAIKTKMATRSRRIVTHPMQVVLPISRNDELHLKSLKRPSTIGLLKAGVIIFTL